MAEPKCPIANMVCPRNNDPAKGRYCPAWTEYMETNAQNGEERLQRECLFTAMPKFMIHTLQAANRPAAAIESVRNEVAEGLGRIGQAAEGLHQVAQDRRRASIEHGDED